MTKKPTPEKWSALCSPTVHREKTWPVNQEAKVLNIDRPNGIYRMRDLICIYKLCEKECYKKREGIFPSSYKSET